MNTTELVISSWSQQRSSTHRGYQCLLEWYGLQMFNVVEVLLKLNVCTHVEITQGDENFFLELVDGKYYPKKRRVHYYQVQAQMKFVRLCTATLLRG